MIRQLLRATDSQLLTAAIGVWLACRATADAPAGRRAIAVDGKALRGSRTTDSAARHVTAACDQNGSVILASTEVDGHTNEITRFQPLLEQIGDLRRLAVSGHVPGTRRTYPPLSDAARSNFVAPTWARARRCRARRKPASAGRG